MISRILNFIREKIREALDTVSSWFSRVYSYIHSYVGSAIESLKTWVINFVRSAIAGIRRVVQHVHHHITKVVKHVHHHITNITKHIHYHVTKVVEHIHHHVTKVVQHVHKHITNVTKHIYHHVTKVTKVIGLTIGEAEKLILKHISPLTDFYNTFSRKITDFFHDPWAFLWNFFPLDIFMRSLSQAIRDLTGERRVFEDHFKELPTPFEIVDETESEITQVKPEMAPSLFPLVRENVQAIAREKTKEWERAWVVWERVRKELLKRLEL